MVTAEVATTVPQPLEWWERGLGRARHWAQARPAAIRRLLVVRSAVAWAAFAVVLAVLALRPDLRLPARVLVWNFVMVLVWFVLARTKTVSWGLVAGLFTVTMCWQYGIDQASRLAASLAGIPPLSDGGRIGIGGILEETFKLAPLLVLAVAAPGRVRRFAVIDWAVIGYTLGAAYNTVESGLDTVLKNQPPRGLFAKFDLLFGGAPPQRPPIPWNPVTAGSLSSNNGQVVGAGHAIWTMLAALGLGVAVAAWRAGARRGGWRLVSPVIGAAGLALAVSDHLGYTTLLAIQPDIDLVGFPPGVRTFWTLTGRGHLSGVFVAIGVLTAVAIDVHHRRGAMGATADLPTVAGVADPLWWSPATTADRLTSATRAAIAARHLTVPPQVRGAARLAWRLVVLTIHAGTQWTHDLAVIVTAHQRERGEGLAEALRRGRAAAVMTRRLRHEAVDLMTPGTEPEARSGFRRAWIAIGALLLVGGLAITVSVAAGIGPRLADTTDATLPFADQLGGYLAGMLDCVGDWWDSLGLWGQLLVTAGIAAFIVIAGASMPVAMTAAGIATYGMSKAHGAATLSRDPAAATRNYLATATPASLALDIGEAALTFIPAGAGANSGRVIRTTVKEFADDPAAWVALRRATMRSDAGIIDPVAFLKREPIELADGTMHSALNQTDEAAFDAWLGTRRKKPAPVRTPADIYQRRIYGPDEPLLATSPTKTWADGSTASYGAVGDAKFVDASQTFYDPSTLSPSIRHLAVDEMDRRLAKYGTIITDPSNPIQAIEIVTNNHGAALFIESRIKALDIRGYVRLVP